MAGLPIDTILQEVEDFRETIKCGAVNLSLEKLAFSFSCGYCDLEFDNLRLFAEHFQQHLVMTESDNNMFLKNAEDDNENAHIMNVPMNENFPNSNVDMINSQDDDNEENVGNHHDMSLRDYQIEMLDDSTQDNVEFVSNNETTEDQFVYQVRLFKHKDEDEAKYDESLLPNKIDINKSEIQEGPELGFDIIPDTNFRSPVKIKKEISYICEICGIKFAEASTLQVHIQRHNRCQFCQQHFASKDQLKQHIKTHAAERHFICEECGQSYKNAESLLTHQQHHVVEQLFICNTCGRSFNEERVLHDHIQTHTSSRPFICKECNMTFSRQGALMLHASMHSDIRKFSCTICRMTFAQNSGLLSHMKDKHRKHIDSGE